MQPWILSLPPLWFLGLYEWILGTSDPMLLELARRAAIALATCAGLTIVTYALAYRRLMVSVVETGTERRSAVARVARGLLVRAAGRHPAARAAAEFFTATLARVERQRFVLAIAFGAGLAWGLVGLYAYEPSPDPQAALLAMPIAAMMFLLAGLRVASSLPADVRAAWVFEVHDLSRRHARQALERVMFVLGVLPPVLVSAPIYLHQWGSAVAATHAVVMTALGIAVIQLLIWHCDAMPCGQQWIARRLDFGRRWPLHVTLFFIVVSGVPALEVVLFRSTYGTIFFTANVIALAFVVRYLSATHAIVPTYEEVDPVAGILRIQ